MRRGDFADLSEAEATTLSEILERYRQEVTPEKSGYVQENYRVLQLMRHPISLSSLASLRNVDFSDYRNDRIKQVGPKTIQLELALLSAVLSNARRDWSIPVENSVTDIRKPKLPRGRDRRLVDDEESRLFEAAVEHCNILSAAAFKLFLFRWTTSGAFCACRVMVFLRLKCQKYRFINRFKIICCF